MDYKPSKMSYTLAKSKVAGIVVGYLNQKVGIGKKKYSN